LPVNLKKRITCFHAKYCTTLIPVPGGIISRTTQLVRGLRNIDAFGFEDIQVGNNPAEIVRAVIDGISAFRDDLITMAMLAEYLENKKGMDGTGPAAGNFFIY